MPAEDVTSLQDLLDLDVVDAEAAVVLEVVGVVEEGSSQREEQSLGAEGEKVRKVLHWNPQTERKLSEEPSP